MAAIVAAGVAAYANSFGGPFVFLDVPAIVSNPSIRHLSHLRTVLLPPSAGGLAVGGRPVVNLSLAINYALGGTRVWGYHAFNVAVHILAGLTLFGIARPTIGRWSGSRAAAKLGEDGSRDAISIRNSGGPISVSGRAAPPVLVPFFVALLWEVHPLQTEAVTFVIQRAESLMGLFYLLTVYCFIRWTESLGLASRECQRLTEVERLVPETLSDGNSGGVLSVRGTVRSTFIARFALSGGFFAVGSVICCLLAMGTKEVAVSIPVIVFLYDRTFVSGSFRAAWRRHRRMHLALAAAWILLAWLVVGYGGSRGGTSGFGLPVSWGAYALTQFPAIVRYLRLALWPHPLDFHYGTQWVGSPWDVAPQAAIVIALAAASAWGFFAKRQGARAAGFAGLFFFAILAPTSLVPGMTQTAAEHRMYLALIPVIALVVGAIAHLAAPAHLGARAHIFGGGAARPETLSDAVRVTDAKSVSGRAAPPIQVAALLAAAVAGIFLTAARNRVYRSELALWGDTAAKSPWNPYPFNNLGIALDNAGHPAAAAAQFRRALELKPDYPEAHNDLGLALAEQGRIPEAIGEYGAALRLRPDYPEAQANLGVAYADSARLPEAIGHLETAVRQDPAYANAQNDLAVVLADTGRLADAIPHYEAVLRIDPSRAETHYNLANALLGLHRTSEAIAQYGAALALKPNYTEAEANLGAALAESGRLSEAVEHYEAALRLDPSDPDVQRNLGMALKALGRGR